MDDMNQFLLPTRFCYGPCVGHRGGSILHPACQCDFGYRRRRDHSRHLGSRTGRESCPFIRFLSVRSIEIDTSFCEVSMTLVMTMSVEDLAIAKGVSSPLTLWDNVIDFPDISILEHKRLKPRAASCCFCPPTHLTSRPLRKPSPN